MDLYITVDGQEEPFEYHNVDRWWWEDNKLKIEAGPVKAWFPAPDVKVVKEDK